VVFTIGRNTHLEKLLAARRFDALDGEEAVWIATFVAAQYLRAKNFREAARDQLRRRRSRAIRSA